MLVAALVAALVIDAPALAQNVAGNAGDPIEARRVKRALSALRPSHRRVIERAYYDHRTLAEIASETDLPLGTVKSRLSSALRLLHAVFSAGRATVSPRYRRVTSREGRCAGVTWRG